MGRTRRPSNGRARRRSGPERLSGTLAFMFETRYVLEPTAYASGLDRIDTGYPDCWDALERRFRPPAPSR